MFWDALFCKNVWTGAVSMIRLYARTKVGPCLDYFGSLISRVYNTRVHDPALEFATSAA